MRYCTSVGIEVEKPCRYSSPVSRPIGSRKSWWRSLSAKRTTQHLGTGGHQHVVADGGVALALVLTGTAKGHAVVQQAIIANLGGLADDDTHAVVDDQTAADGSTGMDLNTGPESAPLRNAAGDEGHMTHMEKMGDAMIHGCMDAGIEEEDLQLAPGGRVAGLIGFQQFGQLICHIAHTPVLRRGGDNKKTSRTPLGTRGVKNAVPLLHSLMPTKQPVSR